MSAFNTYIAACRKCGAQDVSLCRENNSKGGYVGFYFTCQSCGDDTAAVMLTKDIETLVDWEEISVTVKV